jgi:hypothetical protein
MDSTPKPVEADDPHDAPAIAPGVNPPARTDKVLADRTSDAKSRASDQKPGSESGSAPTPAIDTTFRAAAAGNVRAPREKPPIGKWATSAITAFLFALCSGIAAAGWQHYGDAARQMVADWTPRFALASSPPPEQAAPAGRPDASAVQAFAADQTPPQPIASARPPQSAASDTAALSPESVQLIRSMARDLAAMEQQVEQLKAGIADLKAGQQAMARDIPKTSEKTSEIRTPEAKTQATRTSVQSVRPKMPAPPLPLRSAAAQPRRPMPAYPPMQAAAAPPLPAPAAPPQPAPPPQVAAAAADQPVLRPPRPLP